MTPIPVSPHLPDPILLTATWVPGSCKPGGTQDCNDHAVAKMKSPSDPPPYPTFGLPLPSHNPTGQKRPMVVGHPPPTFGAWPEGPSPSFLLERTQDVRQTQNLPPNTLVDPELTGWLSPEAQPVLEPEGSPGKGSLGMEGDEKNAIKKKLNILKIYIYRFVFTSSPQIKSSKSTFK